MSTSDLAIFSHGFRLFFLAGAAWAAAVMVIWLGFVADVWDVAPAYGAYAWHAHETLFGFAMAVITGFLLTAVPNWTGRLPIRGNPLVWLFLLWAAGRLALMATGLIGPVPAMIVDSIFPIALALVVAREIVAGSNWRNLKTVALISVLAAANIGFQVELLRTGSAEYMERTALAAVIGLIMLIGGRIIPSFTRNWLARRGPGTLPQPFGQFDRVTLVVAGVALVAWIVWPMGVPTGVLQLIAGAGQAARLARWAGARTLAEPLVTILHIGYAFVPLGFLLAGLHALGLAGVGQSAAVHTWTVGAIGVMTLAVMTRASLGHTGHALTAGGGTVAIYALVAVAALARVAADLFPAWRSGLLLVAGLGWIAAFGGFVAIYGPILVRPRLS